MPLVPASMVPGFLGLTSSYPPSAEACAQKMASAYNLYAKAALALGGTPILTGGEKTALQGILLSALKSPNGVIGTYASAWYQGVVAFWSPVIWTPPPGYGPGALTVPPAATIQSSLISGMSHSNSGTVWAQLQANALHSGVAGIMSITFPPVPPTPAPLVAPVL
jgi:hypothetical protein